MNSPQVSTCWTWSCACERGWWQAWGREYTLSHSSQLGELCPRQGVLVKDLLGVWVYAINGLKLVSVIERVTTSTPVSIVNVYELYICRRIMHACSILMDFGPYSESQNAHPTSLECVDNAGIAFSLSYENTYWFLCLICKTDVSICLLMCTLLW